MRTIGISIPTYNRSHMTLESFRDVYDDERVQQITIVDDASDWNKWEELQSLCKNLDKVKLVRNEKNLDCYANKFVSICHSDMEWNILLDSDNVIDKNYLDVLFSFPAWASKTILTPSFAKPEFDFRNYEGLLISKQNVADYIHRPMFEVCLNACNYFVNRGEYVKVWDGSVDPVTSDSIYFMSKWFEAGNNLYITPSLHYHHRIHGNSHYNSNNHRTPVGFHQSILQKLKELR